jgi:hypothetical protein
MFTPVMKPLFFAVFFMINYCAMAQQKAAPAENGSACLKLTQLTSDSLYLSNSLQTMVFLVHNISTDTVQWINVRCQASDQMPVFKSDFLAPGQQDFLVIKSKFSAFSSEGSVENLQRKRTAIVQTDRCNVAVEMNFVILPVSEESLQTSKNTYSTGDTLVVISNGNLSSTGDMGAFLHWGAQRLTFNGWEEEVDIHLKAKLTRGPGYQRFANKTEAIALFGDQQSNDLYTFSAKGIYRLYTYNEYNKWVYSSLFLIE